PNAGYYISSVKVDGVDQSLNGAKDGSYTLPAIENVTKNIDVTVTANPKMTITISAASAEKVYDGKSLTSSDYTISGTTVDLTDCIKVSVSGTITDAGSAENVVSCDTKGHDYMFNVINKVNGKLTVTKRDAVITVNNAQKIYGESDPVFVKGYSVTGLVNAADLGDIKVVRENSTEKAGSYDDVLNANYTENPNYNVTVNKGDFVINKASNLKVSVADQNFMYDAKSHSIPLDSAVSFKATGSDEVSYKIYADSAASKEIENKFTDAGVYNVWVQASDANHNTAMAAAKVTVSPREVVMTSGSSEREKNGKALKNDKITVTGDGFADGEGASYDVTGSQTSVGSSDNTFDYTLKSNTIASNYSIKKVYGKLKVTKNDDSSSDSSSGSSSSDKSSSSKSVAEKTSAVLGDKKAPESDGDDGDSGVLGDRDTPNTGDSANIVVWLSILLASGASIVSIIAALARRKRED
nr:hypothetical protein [Lachnospiraceae bacterium]